MIERGWIRKAIITAAQLRETQRGGVIVCRTNRSGSNWIMLSKASYLSMANSIDSVVPRHLVAETVRRGLIGKKCDISMTHCINPVDDTSGALRHQWDGRAHLPGTQGLSDYRLGDGGHG